MSTTRTVKRPAAKKATATPKKTYARRTYTPRAATRYTGTGDYVKAPRAIRPSKSTTKSLGGTIGAHLGHGLQTVIKALTGFGDYEVEQNSLMPPVLGGDPPIIQNSRNNSHIVHHREYIGDVYASTAFSIQTYPLNPGLISSFPWVSQQADSYEQYKFRGMVFEFKSMSSDAVLSSAASSSLGTVVMSTQYNALEAPFSDKRTMENYEYANSCKPSCSMLHPIECKMSQNTISELYVRTGEVSQGDRRLYDLGNFSIAVQGMQNVGANQVIGELWVSYELEFFKPKLLVGGGALLTDHWYGTGANVFTLTDPLGLTSSTLVKRSGSNLGCTIQQPAVSPYGQDSIIFPAWVTDGTYLITYAMGGTVATVSSPSYTASGTTVNIDVVSTQARIMSGNTTSWNLAPAVGATSTTVLIQQVVRIIQSSPGIPPGIQFAFAGGALPTGTTVLDLTVTQMVATIN